jgi:hypothetical protein
MRVKQLFPRDGRERRGKFNHRMHVRDTSWASRVLYLLHRSSKNLEIEGLGVVSSRKKEGWGNHVPSTGILPDVTAFRFPHPFGNFMHTSTISPFRSCIVAQRSVACCPGDFALGTIYSRAVLLYGNKARHAQEQYEGTVSAPGGTECHRPGQN